MGHIKEPKGVDFIIKSEPLTEEEKKGISEFIQQYKIKTSSTRKVNKTRSSILKETALNLV